MPLDGEHEPSPLEKVRNQVALYERTGGREGNTSDTGPFPVVIVSTRGSRSGLIRKNPLVRVEHDGSYALVASHGGADTHPTWYYNLKAHPDQVTVQDGPEPWDGVAREVTGEERALWWERAVAAFPRYADHQQRTEREIPVFVVERRD